MRAARHELPQVTEERPPAGEDRRRSVECEVLLRLRGGGTLQKPPLFLNLFEVPSLAYLGKDSGFSSLQNGTKGKRLPHRASGRDRQRLTFIP